MIRVVLRCCGWQVSGVRMPVGRGGGGVPGFIVDELRKEVVPVEPFQGQL